MIPVIQAAVTPLLAAACLHAAVDLRFERSIAVDAPAGSTWRVVAQSFRDSRTSPVWPHELETIESPDLAAGGSARATYRIPIVGPVTQTYRIVEFDPSERQLRYETTAEHPLRGGATIRVVDVAGRARLEWVGGYDVSLSPRAQISAAFTRFLFLDPFFDSLEDGLARWATQPME